jgi:signal-transduction protein with cAMP-binding, CBS, and nucleotidyltransferase domain
VFQAKEHTERLICDSSIEVKEILKSIPCFTDLDSNTLDRLLEKVSEQNFSKDEVILQQCVYLPPVDEM